MDLAAVLARIELRLKILGVSANAASMAARKPDAIRNLQRAVKNNARTGISTATIAALAPVLKTTPSWLLEGIGDENALDSLVDKVNQNTLVTKPLIDTNNPIQATIDPPDGVYLTPADHTPVGGSGLARDVPVLGVAVGGEDADFQFNGETIDRVRRPVGIAGQQGVYALYVVGTSMEPKYEEGDLIYVSTTRPPMIGDYVVIELHSETVDGIGKGYIKRLKSRNSSKIICTQHNPPKEVTFARNRVKAFHRVIPWNELLGT